MWIGTTRAGVWVLEGGKLSPLKGMQRLLSARAVVDLGKSILKLVVVTTVLAAIVLPSVPGLEQWAALSPAAVLISADGHAKLLDASADEAGAYRAPDGALSPSADQFSFGLVLAEIGRTNNLRVQQDELGKAMIAQARRFQGQEQMVLDYLRKTPDAQEALAAPILEEKVVDFILEMAKVEERSVEPADLLREPDDETTSAAG